MSKAKQTWASDLQSAAPVTKSEPKANPERERLAISVQDQVANQFRVIVKSERKPMGEVRATSLRLPIELSARLDTHVAGQRHAAILALIEFGLDELIRQHKVLEIK